MALSKAELRDLALQGGPQTRLNWLKSEMARILEEFPELQTSHADESPQRTKPKTAIDNKPTINDQVLEILVDMNGPARAGHVFQKMQGLPIPATANNTSVHTSLAQLAKAGLAKRTDDGYQINSKGRKYVDEKRAACEETGGHA